MKSKNRPSLLNTVSFRSKTVEHVVKKILATERQKFGVSYAPVPQIAAKILNNEISYKDLINLFNKTSGDTFEIHRLNVALALSTFGQTLNHPVSPLKPFYQEILREKIWIKVAPLGYFIENDVATIIDYNPRKSLRFTNSHAAFSGAITVPPYSTETSLFDFREHKYILLDLSSENESGNRVVQLFHSDDVGIMKKEDVEVELQIIADAYEFVRNLQANQKIPIDKKELRDAPLFENVGIKLTHE